MDKKQRDIRTKNEGLKLGEAITVGDQLGARVKHGKKTDFITLNEIASQICGIEVRCEVIPVKR